VISIQDSNVRSCPGPGYPGGSVWDTVGWAGEAGQLPMVCGGVDTKGKYYSHCYRMYEGVSEMGAGLTYKRAGAAVAEVGQGRWWVTGGKESDLSVLSSTEVYRSQSGWEPGPSLPGPLAGHCMVYLGRGRVLVVGGRAGWSSLLPVSLLWKGDSWEARKGLIRPRQLHSCILLNSTHVLVTGGVGGGVLDSTELYSLTQDTWYQGPNLPTPTKGASLVWVGDRLLLLDGLHGTVYEYIAEGWTSLEGSIPKTVFSSAMVVQESTLRCS